MARDFGTVDLSMPRLISGLTLRVRFARVAAARLWLAARVMKLAGAIAGCDVEVVTGSADDFLAGFAAEREAISARIEESRASIAAGTRPTGERFRL
jgi:hypothetical protein